MVHRNSIALVGVLFVILMMTGFVVGRIPHASALGTMAPFILPAILTLYFLVVLAYGKRIMEMLAALFFYRPKQEHSRVSLLAGILGYIVVFVALVLLARIGELQSFFSLLQQAFTAIASTGAQIAHLNQGIRSAPPATMVALSYYTVLIFAGIAFLSVTLFFGALRLAYKEGHEGPSSEEVKLEALQVVQQAANSLRNNTDYEETIVKCYRQMCEVLSGRGFIIGADQTAREFASTVSNKLSLGSDAVRGLTFLFEEARYSAHIINDDQRRLAVNSLDSLENALSQSAG